MSKLVWAGCVMAGMLAVSGCAVCGTGAKGADEAEAVKVQSQAISEASYDAAAGTLLLAFERGTYSFEGVPQEVYDAFLKSESQGSFYQSEIRGKYKATKVE